jgi:tetratricopeptide (TPR) repeat protein
VVEAVRAAVQRAADPKAYPEQIEHFGLQSWQTVKLYARTDERGKDQVIHDAAEPGTRLQTSPRDYAGSAATLLACAANSLPAQRYYSLLDSRLEGAARHRSLMQGIQLAPGGEARRDLGTVAELTPEVQKTIQTCRNLQTLADQPPGGLVDPTQLLTQIAPALKTLPEDQGAAAAYGIANRYADSGQWALAREIFLLMLDRYPAHPLSAEACRWLIRHGASSEARRRQELGQFVEIKTVEFKSWSRDSKSRMPAADGDPPPRPRGSKPTGRVHFETKVPETHTEMVTTDAAGGVMTQDRVATRRWFEDALALEPRLVSFGPLFLHDPGTQFCLQAIRRNLGQFDVARKWYAQFSSRQPDGPRRDAALAELWLVNRSGPSPKPLAWCRQTANRPLLDGKLNDSCWQDLKTLPLRSTAAARKNQAAEGTGAAPGQPPDNPLADFPTEVYLAYDQQYLYLALRCRHPADRYVPPVKVRQRDADLRAFDRVSLMLDLDRDYASYFHFQVDQRGCVHEECCQGGHHDATWNPRWFVACHSEREAWQIEAAIPLAELTGDPVTVGKTWACNIVRVMPGRGVQAFSLPADVEPRPEGMGLLSFTADDRQTTAAGPAVMPPVP